MLSTILIVLLVLWLLGVVTSYTAGGLIHLLLVVAVIVVVLDGIPAGVTRMRAEDRDHPREDGAEQRQEDNCLIHAPP
jgi:hypothetical protein